MNLGLKNKIALVTAASRGLGRAVAEELAAEGASLIICSRKTGAIERVAVEINGTTGAQVLGVAADVANPVDVARLVESGIALSVLLAALNNVWPQVTRRTWILAFAFGLVHGFGFASVLNDLGLPRDALAVSLAGFNVGVELGQLGVVLVVVPLIFVLRERRMYRPAILVGGSTAIAVVAAAWFVQRALGFGLS